MSKNLFLLRHARAADKNAGQQDIDRELDSVGLQNSTRMGINLSEKKIRFDVIYCSPAVRALNTASLIAEQMQYDTKKINVHEEIYNASARTLLQVINQLKDEWSATLIVGHNPAITYLAEYLTKSEIGNMTTCGLVKIQFNIDSWAEVSEGNGTLISYEYPDLLNF